MLHWSYFCRKCTVRVLVIVYNVFINQKRPLVPAKNGDINTYQESGRVARTTDPNRADVGDNF